jgi:FAD binding domain
VARAGGARQKVRARYVVGCNGSDSFVRRHLGVTFTDLGFFFDWLIVDPAEASARDAAMIAAARDKGLTPPLPTPAIGPRLLLDDDPLAGHLFLQGVVRRGDRVGRFDDIVGRGFTLVSTVADPAAVLEPDLAEFFASLGGVCAHVAPSGPIHDVNGSYARWFAKHGVGVALGRPDFHVYGTTRAIGDSAGLLARLRRALGAATRAP